MSLTISITLDSKRRKYARAILPGRDVQCYLSREWSMFTLACELYKRLATTPHVLYPGLHDEIYNGLLRVQADQAAAAAREADKAAKLAADPSYVPYKRKRPGVCAPDGVASERHPHRHLPGYMSQYINHLQKGEFGLVLDARKVLAAAVAAIKPQAVEPQESTANGVVAGGAPSTEEAEAAAIAEFVGDSPYMVQCTLHKTVYANVRLDLCREAARDLCRFCAPCVALKAQREEEKRIAREARKAYNRAKAFKMKADNPNACRDAAIRRRAKLTDPKKRAHLEKRAADRLAKKLKAEAKAAAATTSAK